MPRIVAFLAAGLVLSGAAGPSVRADASGVRVEAATRLNEGVAAYNQGDYATAVEKLRRSTALALNVFRGYYYLGLALTGDRRYPEAIEALDVALDLDPQNAPAHVAMGDARLKLGDTEEAQASFARSLKIRGEYPAGLDGLARVYEAKADDDKAVEMYRRAIASNRGYADAYTHLGKLYARQDRYEEAIKLLLEAVTIRPDYAYGFDGLATAYAKLGLESEAVVTIRKAIDLEPRSPAHWANLGQIELQMALPDRAEASFRKALELDLSFPAARAGLAETARRRGDYAQALEHVSAALADQRLDSVERKHLEELKARVEKEGTEIAALEPQVASGSAAPEAVRRLAALYAGREAWGRAVELQAQSEPVGVERERLAYYLLKAGRPRDALAHYAELVQATPRADLEVDRGIALARVGDDRGAADAYRKALELAPAEERARLYLGNSMLRLGRRAEAVAAYKTYLENVPQGTARARVVRILAQIAPEVLPQEGPSSPPPGTGSLPVSGS